MATYPRARRVASEHMADSERISPPRPLLRALPTLVPTGVGFVKNAGLVTEGRPEEFEGLAGRCAVFRCDPAS